MTKHVQSPCDRVLRKMWSVVVRGWHRCTAHGRIYKNGGRAPGPRCPDDAQLPLRTLKGKCSPTGAPGAGNRGKFVFRGLLSPQMPGVLDRARSADFQATTMHGRGRPRPTRPRPRVTSGDASWCENAGQLAEPNEGTARRGLLSGEIDSGPARTGSFSARRLLCPERGG